MKGVFTFSGRIIRCLSICFPLLIGAILNVSAQSQRNTYSQVKIYATKADVSWLQKRGLEFDHVYFDKESDFLITTLNQEDIKRLKALPFKYEILVADEEAEFLKRNNIADFYKNDDSPKADGLNAFSFIESPNQNMSSKIATPAAFTAGSMGGYYTLAEMNAKITALATAYPNLVTVSSIGNSYNGRPLTLVKISDNAVTDESEPEMLYTGLHHAREPLGMMNLIFFMQYLCENYSTNARIKELVDSRELYFVPCMNPDGYERNRVSNPSGGGMHRKNVGPYGSAGNPGTDLNRNYGYDFGYNNVGSSATNSADNYRGPSAFSETESQLLRNFARARQLKLMINHHSYGGYWINSYSVPARTLPAADALFLATSGQQMTRYNFYEVGSPINTVGYEANGSSDDWFFAGDVANIGSVPCFSPEIGLGLSTFWPGTATIIPYCKEAFYGNLQAALISGSFAKVENRTSINLPSLSGNFDFTVRRLGRVNGSVTVTVLPLTNIQSVGAPVTVSSLPNYLDTANRSISFTLKPAISAGNIVRFVYKMETEGVTILDTVSCLYSANSVFTDDMETGLVSAKWTVGSGWNYSSTSAYSGSRSLTESPAGNYGNSSTLNLTSLSTLNLSGATAAFLSFWVRYNTEPGFDRFIIQASSPATSNVYTALPGLHTIKETSLSMGNVPSYTGRQDYWVREVIDLSPHLGQSNVSLRLVFASNASVSNDGVYVDNIEVYKSTLLTLPLAAVNLNGTISGAQALLKWQADKSVSFDKYELEYASDGTNFTTLAVIKVVDQTSFVHAKLASGNNYYRIKLVDKAGSFTYSAVVRLFNAIDYAVRISPTITNSRVQISLRSETPDIITIDVIDPVGRMVKQTKATLSSGLQQVSLDVSELSAQQYFIKITNKNQEIIGVEKIIKQ